MIELQKNRKSFIFRNINEARIKELGISSTKLDEMMDIANYFGLKEIFLTDFDEPGVYTFSIKVPTDDKPSNNVSVEFDYRNGEMVRIVIDNNLMFVDDESFDLIVLDLLLYGFNEQFIIFTEKIKGHKSFWDIDKDHFKRITAVDGLEIIVRN